MVTVDTERTSVPFAMGRSGLVVVLSTERLTAACLRRGWSLQQLAAQARISRPTLRAALRGHPVRPSTAWKLARALGRGDVQPELDELIGSRVAASASRSTTKRDFLVSSGEPIVDDENRLREMDDRDRQIISRRAAIYDDYSDVRIGDFVDFVDGVTRRVSHVYPPEWGDEYGVQTSDGGSFYLGDGYMSFSGSLHPPVPHRSLTLSEQPRPGRIWIFHHDWMAAGNGVDDEIPFRVYRCSEEAPG